MMLYMIIVLVFLTTFESGKYRSDRDQVQRERRVKCSLFA